MLSTLFVAAALAGAPATAAPVSPDRTTVQASAQTSAPAQSIEDLAQKFGAELHAPDYEAALATAQAIEAHPDFAGWPTQRRRAVILMLGLLNASFEHYEAALPWLVQATGWSDTDKSVWLTRVEVELHLHDIDAATNTLTTVVRRFPDALPDISEDFLLQRAHARDADPEAAFALRLALYDAGWRNPLASWVWVSLIDDLMRHDRADEAVALVPLVTNPTAQVQLHALKRYDALMAKAGAGEFDIAQAYDKDLEADRLAAEDTAGDKALDKRNIYISSLLLRGRNEQVLALADAALAQPENKSDVEAAESRTWIMDTRARALMALGRRDEALAQQQAAAARAEAGQDNVSQRINLGWLYLRLGRNADALAAVKGIGRDEASAFGVMQAVQVRACAAHALGSSELEATAYAYLSEHHKDAPGAWRDALACKGDADGIAALMLEQLADPAQADQAVADMHDWMTPTGLTEFDLALERVRAEARTRPEVVAAHDRVARTFTLPQLGDMF
ncbi:MAG: hypothetical protein EBR82_21275 [Caulobacteraceae bacterium]|nr:hypothetical protein [Caulobacteraceae bacterium]